MEQHKPGEQKGIHVVLTESQLHLLIQPLEGRLAALEVEEKGLKDRLKSLKSEKEDLLITLHKITGSAHTKVAHTTTDTHDGGRGEGQFVMRRGMLMDIITYVDKQGVVTARQVVDFLFPVHYPNHDPKNSRKELDSMMSSVSSLLSVYTGKKSADGWQFERIKGESKEGFLYSIKARPH